MLTTILDVWTPAQRAAVNLYRWEWAVETCPGNEVEVGWRAFIPHCYAIRLERTMCTVSIPTLSTERLLLRPFAAADAARVQALAGAPELAVTALNIPHPYPDGAAESWIARHVGIASEGVGMTWAIVRRQGETLLGAISLGLTARHQRGSLGYWLGVPYWNQGYTTEAARRVIQFAFDERGCYRVEAGCFPRNVASARVMEKAGLRYEGILRGYLRKGDTFEDVAMYALLRREFTR